MISFFCRDNFDNEAPFDPEGKYGEFTGSDKPTASKTGDNTPPSLDQFFGETVESFAQFINEIKTSGFCIIKLLFTWPQYISKFWEHPMPSELREVYLKIYRFYL